MVKMMFFCRRRPDITHAAYAEMVLRDHVPLALRHHPTMREYVVNIVDHAPSGEAELDSIAELSFDSLDDYRERLYDSPEGERIIGRDVARFMGGASAYVTRAVVHRELAQPAPLGVRHDVLKMICPIRRHPGLPHAQFVEHWLERHRPLALRHHPGLLRYVANVVEPSGDADTEDFEWDGISELYFSSLESLRTDMFDSASDEAIIREDIGRFIGHTCAYLVSEYVQLRPGLVAQS